MDDRTQMLPVANGPVSYTAPTNVSASVYGSMLTPAPSFTAINSDVNSTAGRPGYDGAPVHYKGSNGIQSFDVWDEYDMDPYRASAWKYFSRFNLKGSTRNDLEKLVHYLQEAIDRVNFAAFQVINLDGIRLKPSVVLPSFGLEGIMYDAALDFLLSFTTPHPKTYLRSAKVQVEAYIRSL